MYKDLHFQLPPLDEHRRVRRLISVVTPARHAVSREGVIRGEGGVMSS
jgi:hypothetical protein